MLTGSQIRRKFLDYFVQHGHKEVHSSSLVPANDPTLLFTNAGMNQFKDVFLGLEKRDYNRATTSQKCVRAGGKHNDLENVGFTNRHHTFFEMLGNFSFGDYFKKDAIAYAWELITSPAWFGIPKDKLYVTIFKGEGGVPRDAEAHDLWAGQGVAKERIYEFGTKDNFWQMGDTGPCGPCSEIHYDMGVIASDQEHGTTARACEFGCDCGRYVEIWNLVFMQFDRDASGKLNPLPKPSIDTGAGLERLASVMLNLQDPKKISNYDTDLFVPLIKRAAELTGAATGHVGTGAPPVQAERSSAVKAAEQSSAGQLRAAVPTRAGQGSKSAASLRVIADHSRAATFLISDGVIPSNEGRGYVVRKIIRRAITHGRLLGQTKPFLFEMVFSVRDLMLDAYPELKETAESASRAVQAEETRFAHTLGEALPQLEEELERCLDALAGLNELRKFRAVMDENNPKDVASLEGFVQQAIENLKYLRFENIPENLDALLSYPINLPGRVAFRLYDTFGMPKDFIREACRDRGVPLDEAGFDAAMEEQRQRARASWKGAAKQTANPVYQKLPTSTFEGYRQTRSENCEVLAILKGGQGAPELMPGDEGEIILDHTPFYAESGGQVGDRGWLYSDDHNTVVAVVIGCYYPVQGVRAHRVIVKSLPSAKSAVGRGTPAIRIGDKVDAVVNTDIREATMRNHTATHLLHAGLREVLGKHVKQAGSLVDPGHLRFDFSHFTAVEDEELQDIEDIINKEVLRNEKVEIIENVPIDVAVNEYHAMALFGEKYGDKVRVIKIGDFSTELCGGTHTGATGEIGLIKILKEGSVSSGVRRVEAITGEGSLRHFRKDHQLEGVVASLIGPTLSKPTLSQKTRKDGAPTRDGAATQDAAPANGTPETEPAVPSPAEALKAELEKKDAEIKRLTRELDQARMKSASSSVASVTEKMKDVKGVKVLAHRVDNLERAQMRTLVDQLRDKLGSGVVVLGSASNGNVALIVGVTKDLTDRIQAGKVIGPVAQKVGGKGWGAARSGRSGWQGTGCARCRAG